MYEIKRSSIHGQGVFATEKLKLGTIVGLITDPYPHITMMGAKINHSYFPNCIITRTNDRHFLQTMEDIETGIEMTVNYSYYIADFMGPDPSWSLHK